MADTHVTTTLASMDLQPGKTYLLVYDRVKLREERVARMARDLSRAGVRAVWVGTIGDPTTVLHCVQVETPEPLSVELRKDV